MYNDDDDDDDDVDNIPKELSCHLLYASVGPLCSPLSRQYYFNTLFPTLRQRRRRPPAHNNKPHHHHSRSSDSSSSNHHNPVLAAANPSSAVVSITYALERLARVFALLNPSRKKRMFLLRRRDAPWEVVDTKEVQPVPTFYDDEGP